MKTIDLIVKHLNGVWPENCAYLRQCNYDESKIHLHTKGEVVAHSSFCLDEIGEDYSGDKRFRRVDFDAAKLLMDYTATSDDPRVTRGNIRACDEEIKTLETALAAAKNKRQQFIDQLKEDGFLLVDVEIPLASRQPLDMTDPKNWKAGDVLECLSIEGMVDMTVGNLYVIDKTTYYKNQLYITFRVDANYLACRKVDAAGGSFKFHSRPTK